MPSTATICQPALKVPSAKYSIQSLANFVPCVNQNIYDSKEYVIQVERLLGPNLVSNRRSNPKSKKLIEKDENDRIRPTTWTVQRRYNDFRNLHLSIQTSVSGLDIQFPGKKMTGNLGNKRNRFSIF